MSGEQPFLHLFESLGRLPQSHSDAINREAYQALLEVLSVPLDHPGRCILLRAPRAGHGKTHLLSRIQHHLAPGHEFIPLHPASGCRIDAPSVIDDALRRLGRPLPAAGGLCGLDLIVRRLYSLALQPLVSSGEVPCIDRDGALASLRNRPLETFDFHHPSAVTAHWIRDNFEVLGPRLALELSNLTGIAPRAVGFWVDALFHFAVTPIDVPGRVDALALTVFSSGSGDGVAMERLSALLALLSLLMRVVLVADDLEGFSADETAALRLAAFIGSLRHTAERLDVVLSLNRDIWESAFIPRLSGGLADRLSEVVVELEPLTDDQIVALLESRAPGLGMRVLDYMRSESLETHARGVLRSAAAAWTRASRHPVGAPPPAPRIDPPPALVETAAPAPVAAAVAAALAAFSEETPATPVATPEVAPTEPHTPAPADPAPPPAEPTPPQSPFQAVTEPILEPAPPVEPTPLAIPEKPVTPVVSTPYQPTMAFTPPPAWQAPVIHEAAPPPAAPAPPPAAEPSIPAAPQPDFLQAPPAWDPPVIQATPPVAPDPVSPPAITPVAPPQVTPSPVFQAPSAWQSHVVAEPQIVAPEPPSAPVFEPPAAPQTPAPSAVPEPPPAWQPPAFHELSAAAPVFEAVAPSPAPVEAPQPVYSTSPVWQPAATTPAPEAPAAPEIPAPQPFSAVFETSAPAFEPPAPQPEPITPEPAPVFQASPPAWQAPAFQPATPAPQPPMWQSPAPQETPPPLYATPVGTPTPATWHEATAPSAPFSQPTAQPAAEPAPAPAPAAETQPPIDQDRVEDLLRQFRERYSRPNP